MYRIIERQPTPEERPVLATVSRADPASWGCLILIFGIAFPWILHTVGRRVGTAAGVNAASLGGMIGLAVGLAAFAAVAVSYYKYERKQRRRGARDRDSQIVQEIDVKDSRVVEIALINDNEPILCFEIDRGKLLYLQGQWLRDPETYGVDPPEGDPDEETINGLSGSMGFPNRHFTIARLPHSGRVLSIRTHGEYVAPESEVDALKAEYSFGDSELLDGELAEIGTVLERAHQRSLAPEARDRSGSGDA